LASIAYAQSLTNGFVGAESQWTCSISFARSVGTDSTNFANALGERTNLRGRRHDATNFARGALGSEQRTWHTLGLTTRTLPGRGTDATNYARSLTTACRRGRHERAGDGGVCTATSNSLQSAFRTGSDGCDESDISTGGAGSNYVDATSNSLQAQNQREAAPGRHNGLASIAYVDAADSTNSTRTTGSHRHSRVNGALAW